MLYILAPYLETKTLIERFSFICCLSRADHSPLIMQGLPYRHLVLHPPRNNDDIDDKVRACMLLRSVNHAVEPSMVELCLRCGVPSSPVLPL